MTETRPPRPVLATVICIWEASIAVLALASRVAIRLLHRTHVSTHHAAQASTHAVPSSPLHMALLILAAVLAIAGAIALWQMRRIAFIFFAARFAVELVMFVAALVHPSNTRTLDSLIPLFIFVIDIAALALNAAIAWYVWQITLPKPQPAPAIAPDPVSPPPDPGLTTSQFYLSPDHEQTIHKD